MHDCDPLVTTSFAQAVMINDSAAAMLGRDRREAVPCAASRAALAAGLVARGQRRRSEPALPKPIDFAGNVKRVGHGVSPFVEAGAQPGLSASGA
jgi:hypothetical protein